jgi:hypothetical protein
MEKFIKIPVGSDELIVRVSNVVKVIATSTILTTITYEGGATASLDHAAATGNAQVVHLQGLIKKALATDWTKPIYDATGAVDAFPQAITDID